MRFKYQTILSRIQEERVKADKMDRRLECVILTKWELDELCDDIMVACCLRPNSPTSFKEAVKQDKGPTLFGIRVFTEGYDATR